MKLKLIAAFIAWLALLALASLASAQDRITALQERTAQINAALSQPKLDPSPDDALRRAWDQAAVQGKPLAVFVGLSARDVPGCVSVAVDSANGSSVARVLVVRDPRSDTVTATPLPAGAGDADIRVAAGLEVSRQAAPFESDSPGLRPGEVLVRLDGDSLGGGLPSFLSDLEQYSTARRTQITFRRWSGYIGSVDRSTLLLKWRVPGGMEGVRGWSSKLYRTRGVRARVFLVRQDPNDGSSAVTWGRSYPDGTVFADVLRNARGQVFEVRAAEKRAGKWERFVAYKNVAARPHGYVPLTSAQCAACHAGAGMSEYGGAANPGADTVLSEPIPIVERGETVQGGFGTQL